MKKMAFIILFVTVFFLTGCLEEATQKTEEAIKTTQEQLDDATKACEAAGSDPTNADCIKQTELEEQLADLSTQLAALQKLAELMPSETDIDSTLTGVDSTAITDVVETSTFKTDVSIKNCIKAMDVLKNQPQFERPQCFGPTINYTDHPDSTGVSEDGTLPTGDLGIFSASDKNGNACASTVAKWKLSKVQFEINVARQTQAMLLCMAAVQGKEIPADGSTVNLKPAFSPVTDKFTVNIAKIEKMTDTDGTYVKIVFDGTFKASDGDKQMALSAKRFDPVTTTSSSGDEHKSRINMIFSEGNDHYMESLWVKKDDTYRYYKLLSTELKGVSKTHQEIKDAYFSTGSLVIPHNEAGIGNIDLFKALKKPSENKLALAYGWVAGSGDDYNRVLNLFSNSTTGYAYYGYVKSPTTQWDKDNLGLNLNKSTSGMICNWAGPNNNHTPVSKVQFQKMTHSSGSTWTSDSVNIQYVPTNSCDWGSSALTTSTFDWTINGVTTTIDKTANATWLDLLDQSNLGSTSYPWFNPKWSTRSTF